MKILIIGSGGREHALAWKIAKSKDVKQVFVAPGNVGITWTKKCSCVDIKTDEELLRFALEQKIDITIVGPENFLVNGIVDLFKKNGLRIFGPSKEAAQLEGSKAFSKEFMRKYKVATARYHITDSYDDAIKYVHEQNKFPIVIKADGLAAGKGVFIATNITEAESIIHQYMVDDIFKGAGKKIVIEEFLSGVEASIICVTDGNYITPLVSGKDHKQVFNGNTGPNTGGMGVVCPNKHVTKEVMEDFEQNIMLKTIEGIKDMRMDFCGFVFFGVMITPEGCKLLEYNVRMGDPEAQSILPLMKTDLCDLLQHAIDGNLERCPVRWHNQHSINVVIASKGYPGNFTSGEKIKIYNWVKKFIFVSAIKKDADGNLVTSGGRIMSVHAKSYSSLWARLKVYFIIQMFVRIKNTHHRTDIGIAN